MPTPAEAAKVSDAERVALEKVTVACKAEAKAMNLWWLKNRKYVKNCIERTALQDRAPSMDIWEVRGSVNMKGLRRQRPEETGCDPMC